MTTQALLINRNGTWHLQTPEGQRMDPTTHSSEGTRRVPNDHNINHILRLVTERTGVSAKQLHSDRRDRQWVRARYLAMWLARKSTKLSTPAIGDLLNRDHSVVLHGLKRAEQYRAEDPAWRQMSDELLAQLQGDKDE